MSEPSEDSIRPGKTLRQMGERLTESLRPAAAPTARRVIVLVVDGTDAAESLNVALQAAVAPPWKPVPRGENVATYKQERWDQESADAFLLDHIKRAAPKIHWLSSSVVPNEVTGA